MGNAAKRGARAIERADQTKEAADLRRDGYSLAEIAEKQRISASTVMRRLDAYCERHPMESVEKLRALSLRRTDRAIKAAMPLLDSADDDTRLEAAKTVARLERIRADISGVVKSAPPVVNVTQVATALDTSALEPDELVAMQKSIAKMKRTRENATTNVGEKADTKVAAYPNCGDGKCGRDVCRTCGTKA